MIEKIILLEKYIWEKKLYCWKNIYIEKIVLLEKYIYRKNYIVEINIVNQFDNWKNSR